jgi:ankyrin repeat protein
MINFYGIRRLGQKGNFGSIKNEKVIDLDKWQANLHVSLVEAISKGDLEAVKSLTQKGADLTFGLKNYNDSLSCAAKYGQFDILKYLNDDLGTPLHKGVLFWAAKNGHKNIIQYLQLQCFDIFMDDGFAFQRVAENGYADLFRHFLYSGADYMVLKRKDMAVHKNCQKELENFKNARQEAALFGALKEGNLEKIKELQQQGISFEGTEKREHALTIAIQHKHLDVVQYFIEECHIDAEIDNGQPVRVAAWLGYFDILKYLIEECGVNIHGSDGQEGVLFMTLQSRGLFTDQRQLLLEQAEYLMKKGADFSVLQRKYHDIPDEFNDIWQKICKERKEKENSLKQRNRDTIKGLKRRIPHLTRRPSLTQPRHPKR